MKKLFALIVFGAGYVLGAKAGRARYEQIRNLTMKVKDNPKVQQTAHQAAEMAREQAPVVKDKIGGAASAVKDKVAHDDHAAETPTYTSTYQQRGRR